MNTLNPIEIDAIAEHAASHLPLSRAKLSDAYYYQSLPLCALDAIYSLGVRYEQVTKVVRNFCERVFWQKTRDFHDFPPEGKQNTISEFLILLEKETDLSAYFGNRCFVNPGAKPEDRAKKGMVVVKFARILKEHHIETFQALAQRKSENLSRAKPDTNDDDLTRALKQLPGLASGVGIRYFYMLAGDDQEVKPDRMIHRYISSLLKERTFNDDEAAELVRLAAQKLKSTYPEMTPRLLDFKIWEYQRVKRKSGHQCCNC